VVVFDDIGSIHEITMPSCGSDNIQLKGSEMHEYEVALLAVATRFVAIESFPQDYPKENLC
jgi:hypothetical protein